MITSFIILCSAAIGLVALLTSALTQVGLSGIDRIASALSPRQRARLWLGVGIAPLAVGLASVVVSLLPVVGLGLDHCPSHGSHHPHLCANHPGPAPGAALLSVAALLALGLAVALSRFIRAVVASERTSRLLAASSDALGDAHVFASNQPQAFVLGSLHPRLHISSALVALGPRITEPVLAHERVHASKHDLLWRAVCPVLGVGHLPNVLTSIRVRLAEAQEMAADAEAAATLPDGRLKMAEALLAMSRTHPAPATASAFAHGDVAARVRALIGPQQFQTRRAATLVSLGTVAALVILVLARQGVHHALETLLGYLS